LQMRKAKLAQEQQKEIDRTFSEIFNSNLFEGVFYPAKKKGEEDD